MSTQASRLTLQPVDGRKVSDVVAERLAAAIAEGSLKPGDRLPSEHELVTQLGVGRTSVREGLQKLQTLGIVRVRKGLGAFVAEPDASDPMESFVRWAVERRGAIEELLELRLALEPPAAGIAALRRSDAQLQALGARDEEYRRAAGANDEQALVAADERFHGAVFDAAQNPLLSRMNLAIQPGVAAMRQQMLVLPGFLPRAVEGHKAILDAIAARDVTAARAAMFEHLWQLESDVSLAAIRHRVHDAASPTERDASRSIPRSAFELGDPSAASSQLRL